MKPQAPNTDWTTLLDPALGEQFNYRRPVHSAWFLPVSENILGRCVTLLIPECELQNVYVINSEPLAVVNRPQKNKNVRHWLRHACKIATDDDCSISFSCDTSQQADQAAKIASQLLPNHRRAAIERMYDPATRTLRGLS